MSISPARLAAFDILLRVEKQNAYAAELLHSERTEALAPADRSLCMDMVMGVLRWRSWLDQTCATLISRSLDRVDLEVLIALRLGAYQLVFLQRVPPYAAVDESVSLTRRAKKSSAAGMVNAVLRKVAKSATTPTFAHGPAGAHAACAMPGIAGQTPAQAAEVISAATAHPLWLVERWIAAYGITAAAEICASGQSVPTAALRWRRGADSAAAETGIQLAPGALLKSARRVFSGEPSGGRLMMQDEASQLVAALVGKGSRILDSCAAPGGKTSVIADFNPNAEIVALELHPHRARLMRRLVEASNVRILAADVRSLPVSGLFDRVLADVPCSGTGTLARNPEIKWRLSSEDLAALHTRQVEILQAALAPLAPGGRLIYATCSLSRKKMNR